MTKELLQKEFDKQNIKVNILSVKKTNYGDFEVIFTRDSNYFISEEELLNRGNIVEPEEDELVDNLEDAIIEIKFKLSTKPWFER